MSSHAKVSRWPWVPFVDLSVIMALVPGFLLGGSIMLGRLAGLTLSGWYLAARQAHGHAQLVGWGGAMILGVALQFLPRLRGSALKHPGAVRWFFTMFAGGLGLHVILQPIGPVMPPGPSRSVVGVVLTLGIALETLGLAGLLLVLVQTLRGGPPLSKKKAFAGVVPLLTLSAVSLVGAMFSWLMGIGPLVSGGGFVLSPTYNWLAGQLLAFGFVPAVSIAMSARLFPLFFHLRPARQTPLHIAAVLLGLGVVCDVVSAFVAGTGVVLGVAALARAGALVSGAVAVRAFEKRLTFPGDDEPYVVWRHAAALGGLWAYVWACLAAIALALVGLRQLGVSLTPQPVPRLLAVHLVGAGFMTLLILGVAPMMLPGFGGTKPTATGLVWAAVIAGNVAVVLRGLPLVAWTMGAASNAVDYWSPVALAGAGLVGAVAVLSLAGSLWKTLSTAARG